MVHHFFMFLIMQDHRINNSFLANNGNYNEIFSKCPYCYFKVIYYDFNSLNFKTFELCYLIHLVGF